MSKAAELRNHVLHPKTLRDYHIDMVRAFLALRKLLKIMAKLAHQLAVNLLR